MTPAPSRTADNARFGEDEVREAIARFLWDERYGHLPDASWDQAHEIADGIPDGLAASSLREMRMRADRLCAGPLALLRSDLAAARKEAADYTAVVEQALRDKDERIACLRSQLQEAQKAGGAMRARRKHLEEALVAVRDRIIEPIYGGIDDTFWMTDRETVVDFIDVALIPPEQHGPPDEELQSAVLGSTGSGQGRLTIPHR